MSEHVLELGDLNGSLAVDHRSSADAKRASADANRKRGKPVEYRFLFAATFLVFLAAAVVECFVPRSMRTHKSEPGVKLSIIQKATMGARTCVAYAFMG